jgi:hypothetical protein
MVPTSETHCESHPVLQQYGSCEQISPTQLSQLDESRLPGTQGSCAHEPTA